MTSIYYPALIIAISYHNKPVYELW